MHRLHALHLALDWQAYDCKALIPTAERIIEIAEEMLDEGMVAADDVLSELLLLSLKMRRLGRPQAEVDLITQALPALRDRQSLPGRLGQAGDFYPVGGGRTAPMELCWGP